MQALVSVKRGNLVQDYVPSVLPSKIADNAWLTQPTVHGVPAKTNVDRGVIFSLEDAKLHNLAIALYIQAVINVPNHPPVTGVRIRHLATMDYAQLDKHSTRQPDAHAPPMETASLVRADSIVNGAKISVHVKQKDFPQTELAKFPSRTHVMHTAESTETQAAGHAEICKDVDGATAPVSISISVNADQSLTRAIQSVPFTSTAIHATITRRARGVNPPALA